MASTKKSKFWNALGNVVDSLGSQLTATYLVDCEGAMIRKDAYDTVEITLTHAQAVELRAMKHEARVAELSRIKSRQAIAHLGQRW